MEMQAPVCLQAEDSFRLVMHGESHKGELAVLQGKALGTGLCQYCPQHCLPRWEGQREEGPRGTQTHPHACQPSHTYTVTHLSMTIPSFYSHTHSY